MSDHRRHRGAHPDDGRLFGAAALPVLREAAEHFAWLLSRDYAVPSSLKLVGDRFHLEARQRQALQRGCCSQRQRKERASRRLDASCVRGRRLLIDGFNLLMTIEGALGGAMLIGAQDGCLRDLMGLHGTWRRVDETLPSLELIGDQLSVAQVQSARWLLDKPVSNSGRLASLIRSTAERHSWPWEVEVVDDPDKLLGVAEELVVSADSVVLDRCGEWWNLGAELVASRIPEAWVVRLTDPHVNET